MIATTIHNITPEELKEMISAIVRTEIQAATVRTVRKDEVAQIWGCSMATVNRAVRTGEIKSIRSGGRPVFNYADVVKSERYARNKFL